MVYACAISWAAHCKNSIGKSRDNDLLAQFGHPFKDEMRSFFLEMYPWPKIITSKNGIEKSYHDL